MPVIQVWHITLKLDDHGTSLSATRLSSFHLETCGCLETFSLLGSSIALGLSSMQGHIAVVDWHEADFCNRSHRRIELKLSYPRKIIIQHVVSRSIGANIQTHTRRNRVRCVYFQEIGYWPSQEPLSVFTIHHLLKRRP